MSTPQSGPPWPGQPGPFPPPGQPGPFPPPGQAGPFPPPGQYGAGPPGGFEPPRPSRTTRNTVIAIVAVLAVAGAVIGIVLATTGKTKHDADRSGAPTTSGSSNRDPSGGSAGGGPGGSSGGGAGAAPSESDARAVVDRYLADVNKPDKADAARLVCSAAKPDWDRSVDGPGGDFTVVLTHFEFRTSKAGSQPSSIDVVYLIAAAARADGSQHKTKDVTFTVVNEGGPRICGER